MLSRQTLTFFRPVRRSLRPHCSSNFFRVFVYCLSYYSGAHFADLFDRITWNVRISPAKRGALRTLCTVVIVVFNSSGGLAPRNSDVSNVTFTIRRYLRRAIIPFRTVLIVSVYCSSSSGRRRPCAVITLTAAKRISKRVFRQRESVIRIRPFVFR